MADVNRLRKTLNELVESQADDMRLRDHLEGVVRDEHFPSLTWFWGPLLYERNPAIFRPLILNYFSDWQPGLLSWKRIRWSDHADRLENWLTAARSKRDVQLVRRLLRWKYAGKRWGVDSAKWCAALLSDYESAGSPAARAIVLDEYDDWFLLDEETAVRLYNRDLASRAFLLKHLPQTYWEPEQRKLWARLAEAAQRAGDEELYSELYRHQIPLKKWRSDILALARQVDDAEQLCSDLERRHPAGYGLKLHDALIELLEVRGRDVMPYVRGRLKEIAGGWFGDPMTGFQKLAERNGWWDLWAAAILASRSSKPFNQAVSGLLAKPNMDEADRLARLRSLAGVSREWNWAGFGLARVHILDDEVAACLYRRYPRLIHGPYKPHVTPRWSQAFPQLLAAAEEAVDEELIDVMASRYVTRIIYSHGYMQKELAKIGETIESLADYYVAIRDRDPHQFARRGANVLTQIPAFAIHGYDQLLKTNKLARLLFVRSFEAYLAVPAAVRDLVEGSDIHVQMLAYRVLGQNDDRARQQAAESLDILIGTLLRPLHRKTRFAAFDALLNAARADHESAAWVLERAREALRLPDKRYPKERLIGLIGGILDVRPELRGSGEQPVIYGLEELPV